MPRTLKVIQAPSTAGAAPDSVGRQWALDYAKQCREASPEELVKIKQDLFASISEPAPPEQTPDVEVSLDEWYASAVPNPKKEGELSASQIIANRRHKRMGWTAEEAGNEVAPTPHRNSRGPKPGEVGRFHTRDRALYPDIERLMADGMTSLTAATQTLADNGKVAGNGVAANSAKRLARLYTCDRKSNPTRSD
jgi:hypothetical protein